MICSPGDVTGRSTRRRLSRLRRAGLIQRHRIPLALPATNSAAPVYYCTRRGAEALASYFDDDRYLATNTRHPRADRVAHWIAINAFRLVVEEAVASDPAVNLLAWHTEWEVINKDAAAEEQYFLHVQLSKNPPLSCSPDAGFLLEAAGHRKVFYVENDLATSSPRQIAARKTKGYSEVADRNHHAIHFPETNVEDFSALMVTTSSKRCRAIVDALRGKPAAERWLLINQHDAKPDTFLRSPITYDSTGQAGALLTLPTSAAQTAQEVAS